MMCFNYSIFWICLGLKEEDLDPVYATPFLNEKGTKSRHFDRPFALNR